MQGTRFRHTAQFRRWRPDKPPRACTFAQLEVVPPHELEAIFATARSVADCHRLGVPRTHVGPVRNCKFVSFPM